LSTENFRRKQTELALLSKLYKENLEKLLSNEKIHKNEVRVRVVGDKKLLDETLNGLIKKVEQSTEKYNRFKLNIALAYGGHDEIINAVKKALQNHSADDLNENLIQQNLYVKRNPDLVIRTSGVKRLSGYL